MTEETYKKWYGKTVLAIIGIICCAGLCYEVIRIFSYIMIVLTVSTASWMFNFFRERAERERKEERKDRKLE